jgi:hypothetical protein
MRMWIWIGKVFDASRSVELRTGVCKKQITAARCARL